MRRQSAIDAWSVELARVDHYVEPGVARSLAFWWDDRRSPLILEGPPGGGKTSLALKVARVRGASFYRLQCHKFLGASEALYSWNDTLQTIAVNRQSEGGEVPDDVSGIIYDERMMVRGKLAQALADPHEDVVLLIDELDKIPADEAFEALLLEFLEEHAITVAETNGRLRPKSGKPPRTIITSNAGLAGGGVRESLSKPIQRRGIYIYLPEPEPERQCAVLRRAAPELSESVIRDCVRFVWRSQKTVDMDKHIALSETIVWARKLQWLGVEQLAAEDVLDSIDILAKSLGDQERLTAAVRQIMKYVGDHRGDNLPQLSPASEMLLPIAG